MSMERAQIVYKNIINRIKFKMNNIKNYLFGAEKDIKTEVSNKKEYKSGKYDEFLEGMKDFYKGIYAILDVFSKMMENITIILPFFLDLIPLLLILFVSVRVYTSLI